jgi:hypothetical protein
MEYVINNIDPSGDKLSINLIPEYSEFDRFIPIFPPNLTLTKEYIKNSTRGKDVDYFWTCDQFSPPKHYCAVTIGGFIQ